MKKITLLINLLVVLLLSSCSKDNNETIQPSIFSIEEVSIDGKVNDKKFTDVNTTTTITIKFSEPFAKNTVNSNIILQNKNNQNTPISIEYIGDKVIKVKPSSTLDMFSTYQLIIQPKLQSTDGAKLSSGKVYEIVTSIDSSDKFARISENELLDLVQKQTFKYFWDFGHPDSGMARERSTSGDVVTTGGTGFGIMAMIVAAERGFITRTQALDRIQKITTFLDTKSEKYHGAFAHWINGKTGATVAFSQKDNGADIVETSLLFQGLLTARAYFKNGGNEEKLRNDINRLWQNIEWNWFTNNSDDKLYWHWSKEYNWDMNLQVSGWNESLITYVLAAASPTHPISKTVYDKAWTRNGTFVNGKSFYGYNLPLGPDLGGPLFMSQYSFLGINPKGLTDKYTNYETQNKNHTLINYSYCVENPKKFGGYSSECWGLTASDGNNGYSAHSPTNDRGVIAPTAALSAMPYTPIESMKALNFFYYKLGDKLWKEYGFVDSFNLSEQWFDNQCLAIDQGPIIIMIENYRTGLLWSLFMSNPEVKSGMTKLGFQSPNL